MSQQKSELVATETFSEESISDYLKSHPDFFDRHSSLLMGLKLPHETGGSAISLVERQVAMLRQRNGELERQLKDLVAVAKLNDALVEKIHRLSLKLMAETEIRGRLEVLERSLREEFLAERAVLVLFEPLPQDQHIAADAFLRIIDRQDPELRPFSSFLKSSRPRCGLMRARQRAFIFESEAEQIGSAAMLPLGEKAQQGFLVIGSRDAAHFHPGKGIDFLNRLGELVSAALQQRSDAALDSAS